MGDIIIHVFMIFASAIGCCLYFYCTEENNDFIEDVIVIENAETPL